MIDLNEVDPTPTHPAAQLPTSRAEARARLIEIEDAIAAIRTQIGAADLKRQASRTPIDPDWFHRAKTALRHLERERAELRAAMSALPRDRDRLKDRIIAVVREDYDDAGWARVLDAAQTGEGS
jgi:predicted transcriptional regulator